MVDDKPIKVTLDPHKKILEVLMARLPEFFVTEMDNGLFWRSLEQYKTGDLIVHKDKRYVVQYGWEWTVFYGIPIYCAELEPEES